MAKFPSSSDEPVVRWISNIPPFGFVERLQRYIAEKRALPPSNACSSSWLLFPKSRSNFASSTTSQDLEDNRSKDDLDTSTGSSPVLDNLLVSIDKGIFSPSNKHIVACCLSFMFRPSNQLLGRLAKVVRATLKELMGRDDDVEVNRAEIKMTDAEIDSQLVGLLRGAGHGSSSGPSRVNRRYSLSSLLQTDSGAALLKNAFGISEVNRKFPKLVGIHLRVVGNLSWSDSEPPRLASDDIPRTMNAAKKFVKRQGFPNGQPVKYIVFSDNMQVRADISTSHEADVISSPLLSGSTFHVDRSTQQDANGDLSVATFADLSLMSLCDVLVLTRSRFGLLGASLGMIPDSRIYRG